MAASFSPYQDSPEASRLASPRASIASPRPSIDRPRINSPQSRAYEQHDYFQGQPPSPSTEPDQERSWTASRREDINMFTTSLGWRLDYEACLAYLLLPPAGGIFLLVMEHQSDYVRFHAWQSSLLFAFICIIHIFFSWSSVISWMLFVGDVGLIGWLTWKAYWDAATLDRYEVPFFGPLASSILDDE